MYFLSTVYHYPQNGMSYLNITPQRSEKDRTKGFIKIIGENTHYTSKFKSKC